jgi:hypothetical protein
VFIKVHKDIATKNDIKRSPDKGPGKRIYLDHVGLKKGDHGFDLRLKSKTMVITFDEVFVQERFWCCPE